MKNVQLIIKTKSRKDFLALFNPESRLENLSFGDTWHPSSGYVDEEILDAKSLVKDILEFDYDFIGLIGFTATVDSININMIDYDLDDEYSLKFLIKSDEKHQRILTNKMIEINATNPDCYLFQSINIYK